MKKKILALQSLRFVALIGIFLSHLGFLRGYNETYVLFETYLNNAYITVSFFFILSGFVLAYQYHDRIKKLSQIIGFYVKRFVSLYPLHLVTFLASIPITPNPSAIPTIHIVFINLLLLQSLIPEKVFYFSYNAVSWTVSTLVVCYVFFPFQLMFAKRIIQNKSLVALVLVFCSWFLLFIFVYLGSKFLQDTVYEPWVFYISPITRIVEVWIGIMLYYVINPFLQVEKKQGIIYKLAATCIEGTTIILFIFLFFLTLPLPSSLRTNIFIPYFSLVILLFSLEGGFVSAVLRLKFFVLLGNISLIFFMTHQLVIRYLTLALPIFQYNPFVLVGLMFVISLGISLLVYPIFNSLNTLIMKRKTVIG